MYFDGRCGSIESFNCVPKLSGSRRTQFRLPILQITDQARRSGSLKVQDVHSDLVNFHLEGSLYFVEFTAVNSNSRPRFISNQIMTLAIKKPARNLEAPENLQGKALFCVVVFFLLENMYY